MTHWFKILIAIILLTQLVAPVSAWADSTYQYRSMSVIPDGTRPYQFNFTLSNSTGTNTQFTLYCNGHCQPNFTDVRFYLNDVTLLSYWMEDNTTGKVWINVTGNGTVYAYYGKASATSYSNGTTTFLQYQSETNSEFKLANVAGSGQNIAARIKFIVNPAHDRDYFGLSNSAAYSTDDSAYFDNVADGSNYQGISFNEGASTSSALFGAYTNTVSHIYDISINSTSVKYYMDGTYKATITTNLPNEDMGLTVKQTIAGGGTGAVLYWGFIRNYVFPESILAPWTVEASYPGNATVGYWNFDQATGIYANDSSGYYNNGTITGATWNITDMVNGSSLYFDGTDYITIPASPSINLSNNQSFTGWIKPQSITGTQMIFEKGGSNWEYAVFMSGSSLTYITWQSNGITHSVATGGTLLNDSWAFISGTYSNGSLHNLKINDVLVDSSTSFIGTTSPGTDQLRFGSRAGIQYNFTGLMDEFKLYNYALNSTELTAEYQRFHPFLSYPINGSTITSIYPPQTATINFTWHDSEYAADELIVARDINFNIIDVDIFTSNDFYSATLNNNQTYYWKIRQYNTTTGTYGDTSTTHNFTITSTINPSGNTGIYGVVYEIINGLQVPVSGATVYISNSTSTWSNFQVVGSNGYYLFDGLSANTTYFLSARATGYDNSVTEFVTTGNGTWIQKDIKLTVCISGQDCFGIKNYVKFIATDFFGNFYPNLAVSVYKGLDVTTTYTGTTGTDGGVSFLLTKDQSYRLDFSGSAITTTSITITPGESTLFYVFVSAASPGKYWDNGSYQPVDVIRTSVTTSTSGSLGFINVTYNDSLNQTTSWKIFVNQTNHTNASAPQITIQSQTGTGNASVGFTLTSGFTGEAYIVNVEATHTTFGQVRRSYGVQFYGTKDGSLDYIPSAIMALIAIMILVFVGSFFDSTNFAQGAGLVCAIGWIEVGLGMFSYANMYISVIVGLSIASVIAIVANMNERNKREVVG